MIDKIRSKIKNINPKSPVVIAAVSLAILIPVIFIILSIPSSGKQEDNAQPTKAPLVPGEDYVEGQIVVKFEEEVTDAEINELLGKYNARIKSRIEGINATVIEVPLGQEEFIQAELAKEEIVKYSEPDFIMQAQFSPNDTNFSKQYGLSNTGQAILTQTGTPNADIRAKTAWDVTRGAGVKVAILDSGIDLNHPDFAGKIVAQRAFTTSSVDDKYGHGTHVAGIVAATTNNGQGVAGACPECKIIVGKVLDDKGSGPYSAIASGITWAADDGARVINASIAGSNFSQLLQDAVDYAWGKGAIMVASAGNAGNTAKNYPASLNNVISVAATDNRDQKASFSTHGSWVDIAAPGRDIFSTFPTKSYGLQSAKRTALSYDYISGTSMSSPMVAGVVALIWSTPYGTSSQAVVDRLFATADKISGTGSYWQKGRVNAQAAVGAGVSPSPSTAPTQPQPSITTVPSVTPIPSGAVPTIVCGGSPDNVCGLPSPTGGAIPSGTVSPPPGGIQNPPFITGNPNVPPSISPSLPGDVNRPDTRSIIRRVFERVNQVIEQLNQKYSFLNLKSLPLPRN